MAMMTVSDRRRNAAHARACPREDDDGVGQRPRTPNLVAEDMPWTNTMQVRRWAVLEMLEGMLLDVTTAGPLRACGLECGPVATSLRMPTSACVAAGSTKHMTIPSAIWWWRRRRWLLRRHEFRLAARGECRTYAGDGRADCCDDEEAFCCALRSPTVTP